MTWKRMGTVFSLALLIASVFPVSAESPAEDAILFEKTLQVPLPPDLDTHAFPTVDAQETYHFPADAESKGILCIRKQHGRPRVAAIRIDFNDRVIEPDTALLNDCVPQEMPVRLIKENRLSVTMTCKAGVSLVFTVREDDASLPAAALHLSEASIRKGESTVLSWETGCCDHAFIEPGIGAVPVSGSMTVSPDASTTYVLTGTGNDGVAAASARLTVTGRPGSLPGGSFGTAYEDLIPDDAVIDAYDARRFAVVTGLVRDLGDRPLDAIRVTVFNHPEYGTAVTDREGRFSLPVEGGGTLTLVYDGDGFLGCQRQVSVPWNDVVAVDAIRMAARDSKATRVVFDGKEETVTTHRSTEISDASGSRSSTIVFAGDNPPVLLDESGEPVRTLAAVDIRAAEYPVPESMPAILPPASAYTYCVDLEADGIRRLAFEKPVTVWVENFLGFPVGMAVPAGSYDRDRAVWVPSQNGVVAALLDTDGDGVVDALDATGDGGPDDLDGDGFFHDETAGLGDPELYPPGATFWRVEVSHFTPWDLNWPWDLPPDAQLPNPEGEPVLDEQKSEEEDCESAGIASTISHRSRILHEDIPVPGTEFSLHYAANRVPGYLQKIEVPASGTTVPESLKKIIVSLEIAGRKIEKVLDPLPNQIADLFWDGLDYRGRPVLHGMTGIVRIGFEYEAVYYGPSASGPGFGVAGSSSTGISSRETGTLWKSQNVWIPKPGGSAALAEGWTLSCHHALDPSNAAVLYKGSGLTIRNRGIHTMETVAGNGRAGYTGDGGPAAEAGLCSPIDVDIDASGNLFITDMGNNRIRKVDSKGIITTVAGNGAGGFSGDGGPAVKARLLTPISLTFDGSGNLYISDDGNNRVRRVDTRGVITTVAGNGNWWWSGGDGVPALETGMSGPKRIAADGSGNIYVGDYMAGFDLYVRRIDTRGYISNFIDFGEMVFNDGSGGVFVASSRNQVYRINASGTPVHVAGNGEAGFSGDGGPAVNARFRSITGLALDDRGNLYVTDYGNYRIRRIDAQGIITTVAGDGTRGFDGDGRPATEASLSDPSGLAVDGNGTLYIADTGNHRVRKITAPLFLNYSGTDAFLYPDANGLRYVMDWSGRHLMTVDLETGGTVYRFEYDANGRLSGVTDRFGNLTAIRRNGDGIPTEIVSPDGLVTALAVDGGNRLIAVTGPDGNPCTFEYASGGLLTARVEPEGNRFSHVYDENGRLTDAVDEEGGRWRFSRTVLPGGEVVSEMRTGEGDVTIYRDRTAASGDYVSLITGPSGATTSYFRSRDGLDVTKSLSCGMDFTFRYDIDPRYRFQYIREMTEKTPSSLEKRTERRKTREDTDGDGAPDRVGDTVTVNGRSMALTTDTPTCTRTLTTPEGRTITAVYDPETMVTGKIGIAGFEDWTCGYDRRGRLVSLAEGEREAIFAYDGRGNLSSRTDPENRNTRYDHDAMGRVTKMFRSDGSTIGFTYDKNGNLTSLVNPAGIIHHFLYDRVDGNDAYETPISGSYNYFYDRDRRLTGIHFPSGKEIRGTYSKGNLVRIETPDGSTDIGYNACGTKMNALVRGGEELTRTHDGILLTSETSKGTMNQSVRYGYDSDFRVNTLAYAGGTAHYAWDGDGLLTGAGDFTVSRNRENGLPESVSDGTWNLNRVFNGYGEVERETVVVNQKTVSDVAFTRDRTGRITEKSETAGGVIRRYAYAYDGLGRLVEVIRDGEVVETYRYDVTGTRVHEDNVLRGISGRVMRYSAEEHLLTAGDTAYRYDLDGFLLRKTDAAGDTDYYYTRLGELEKAAFHDGKTVAYLHDPLGRRIAKKVNGAVVEKYLWQGLTRLLAVYDGEDRLLQRFDYADGRMPAAMTMDGRTWYLCFDQAGTLRAVADDGGNVVKRIDCDAFGNIIGDTNPSFWVPFGFAGGLHDRDTGLVRFGFRDYDPDTGRWTAKDPIGFAGGDVDLYGYVLNDPVNKIDPDGLDWKKHGPAWYDLHYEYSHYEREYLQKNANNLGEGFTDLLIRILSDPIIFYFQYTSPYADFSWPWEKPDKKDRPCY